MIFWICGGLAVLAAALATFLSDLRRAALALWGAGLAVGGAYLSLGAELLAVTQWMISTVVAITLVFHASMFGEHGVRSPVPLARKALLAIVPLLAGAGLAAIAWLGAAGSPEVDPAASSDASTHLAALGTLIAERHLLPVAILAFTLLIALVGAGVLARPRAEGDQGK